MNIEINRLIAQHHIILNIALNFMGQLHIAFVMPRFYYLFL
mgnify:CR=1 FL=1